MTVASAAVRFPCGALGSVTELRGTYRIAQATPASPKACAAAALSTVAVSNASAPDAETATLPGSNLIGTVGAGGAATGGSGYAVGGTGREADGGRGQA